MITTIDNKDSWPSWPYLPLVGRGKRNVGLLIDCEFPLRVFLINIFDLKKLFNGGKTMMYVDHIDYKSTEDILKEWKID